MEKRVRFGVSIDSKLLDSFDQLIRTQKYTNRSQAIADIMKSKLVDRAWQLGNKKVAAIISLVYDHHKRDFVNKILKIQHDWQKLIISTQHIHLDHDNCLEIIATQGKSQEIIKLVHKLQAVKGIKHISLTATTIGK
ncbi:MAG: nickel-responsive transcriptional regulator NikR [Candidatus Omnitrophota bacterium]